MTATPPRPIRDLAREIVERGLSPLPLRVLACRKRSTLARMLRRADEREAERKRKGKQ